MATTKDAYIEMHKPRQGIRHKDLHLPPQEGQFQKFAENNCARRVGKATLLDLTSGCSFNPSDGVCIETVTDNSSTITTGAAGIVFFSTDTGDDIGVTGRLQHPATPSGGYTTALARIKVSSAANVGVAFGIWTFNTTMVLPITTDPTDGIFFKKAKNAATMVGRVVTAVDGPTTDNTATILTMSDDTFYTLGFRIKWGAAPIGWWSVDGVEQRFDTAQETALVPLWASSYLPTAALVAGLHFVNNDSNDRTATVDYAVVEADK